MFELKINRNGEGMFSFLSDPDFYKKNLSESVLSASGLIEFPPGMKVVAKTMDEGLLDNSLLKEIEFYDASGKRITRIFAKLQDPFRGWFAEELEQVLNSNNPSRGRVENLFKKVKRKAEYEAGQLRFWNQLGVASPRFLGSDETSYKTSLLVDEDTVIRMGQESFPLTTLFEEYVPGPTHDKDVLAIRQRMKDNNSQITDLHTTSVEREDLQKANKALEGIVGEIRDSLVHATSTLSILGTDAIKGGANGAVERLRKGLLLDRLQRSIYALSIWHEVEDNNKKIEDVIVEYRTKGGKRVGKGLRRAFYNFAESLEVEEGVVFRHGDESFNNSKYGLDSSGERVSVLLDAATCVMSVPELGISRFLASDVNGRSYKEALGDLERIANIHNQAGYELKEAGRIKRFIPYELNKRTLTRFKNAMLLEYLKFAGMKAKQDMYPYRKSRYARFAEVVSQYRNPLIEFPNDHPMGYTGEVYKPRIGIQTLRGNIHEVLDDMSTSKGYESKNVDRVKKFLERNGII